MRFMKVACIVVAVGMLGAAIEGAIAHGAALPLPTSLAFLVAALGGLVVTRLWAD